jgi:PBSX family phage terminase large subunit
MLTVMNPKKSIIPFSTKQIISFNNSDARINIWEGAVRSGKTYISLHRFFHELESGPPGEYAIITRTYDTFKRNLLPIISQQLKASSQYFAGRREMVIFDKTIHVISADDARAESKIRGSTIVSAYCDELTILPIEFFRMLISRCAMGGGKIFATTNPDSPYHWVKTDYLDGNLDVKSWQFTLEDNPVLTQEDKDYLIRQYKGIWFQRFIQGKWVQAEGAIYDSFEDIYHVINFPPGLAQYYFMGVDYGTSNPTSFVLIGCNVNKFPNYWVEDVYYFSSKIAQRQKTDSEYADDLKKFIQGRNVKAIYIDPSAASFKLELAKNGVSNIFDAENEVIDGIRFVSKYINNGTLKVCRNCTDLIKEFHSYVWDSKSSKLGIDKPLKESDHCLDALRYAIYTHLYNKDNQSLSAKDLDRLYNEVHGITPEIPSAFQQPNDYGPHYF